MTPRRLRGHLSWERVDAQLNALREVWVATADAEGRPDAVPVWFWWSGSLLYFSTHPSSAKARNLRRQPAIVVHNGDGSDPITIRGSAALVEDPSELAQVDAAYRAKYVDPASGTQAPLLGFDEAPAAVFRVQPRLVTAWSYADYSTRTDWAPDDSVAAAEGALADDFRGIDVSRLRREAGADELAAE